MDESEAEALTLSKGRRMEESECFKKTIDVRAHKNLHVEKLKMLENEHGSLENIRKKLEKKRKDLDCLTVEVRKISEKVKTLTKAAKTRWTLFNDLKEVTKRDTIRSFRIIMEQHGMKGNLRIKLQGKVMQ